MIRIMNCLLWITISEPTFTPSIEPTINPTSILTEPSNSPSMAGDPTVTSTSGNFGTDDTYSSAGSSFEPSIDHPSDTPNFDATIDKTIPSSTINLTTDTTSRESIHPARVMILISGIIIVLSIISYIWFRIGERKQELAQDLRYIRLQNNEDDVNL